jgi:hypothetical protein
MVAEAAMTKKLFISYARSDQAYADMLRDTLRGWGHKTWMDIDNIPPGATWADEIQKGLEWADAVVAVMTNEALASENVKNEWDWCLVNRHRFGKVLYLLKIDDCIVPMQYVRVNWIDFYAKGQSTGLKTLQTWIDHPCRNIADLPSQPDEFQSYLEMLYTEIVEGLASQILSTDHPLELKGAEAPDQVQTVRRKDRVQMLRAFSVQNSPATRNVSFQSFDAGFSSFAGRVLLLGAPGSGKTVTLLTKARDAVLDRLHDPSKPLPLIARIATWNAKEQTPLPAWLASYTTLSPDVVQRELDAGRALLLLDGLDELGTTQTDEVWDSTGEKKVTVSFDPRPRFLAQLPTNNEIVLTCRVRDYEEIGQKVNLNGAVTLHPLSDDQIENYLSGEAKTVALWQALQAHPDLLAVARRPLLLSVFAFAYRDAPEAVRGLVHFSKGELRDAIFSQYLDRCYQHEGQRFYVVESEPPYTLDRIKTVLGFVAMRNAGPVRRRYYSGINSDQASIADNVLIPNDFSAALGHLGFYDKESSEDVNQFIAYCIRLHLLVRDKAGGLRFIHLLLRDYLVFNYCAPKLADEDRYFEPSSYGFFEVETNPASALARTDERACQLIMKLIREKNNNTIGDQKIRKNAIIALSLIRSEDAVDGLIELLSRDPTDYAAGYSIGLTGNPRTTDVLLEAIRAGNCWAMLSMIELGGDPRAVEAVIPWLTAKGEYARGEQKRATAERLLYESVRLEHFSLLIMLLGNEHPFVRASAAQALGKLNHPDAIAPLTALLTDRSDVYEDVHPGGLYVREFVAKALSKIDKPDRDDAKYL